MVGDNAGAGDGTRSGGAEAGADAEGDETYAAQTAVCGTLTVAMERARAQGDCRQDEQGDDALAAPGRRLLSLSLA